MNLPEDPSNQNPIHKVLSTLATHRVRTLLIGGQACVLYGATEFSRDTDIALQATPENLASLTTALRSLNARRIAIPPFDSAYLQKGHAVHFRCYHPDAFRMRIDVLSVMRGMDPFDELWHRRTRYQLPDVMTVEMLSLPDLVRSKKTQRDKDWPMIRRLVEAEYARTETPEEVHLSFWFRESRTPRMLAELASRHSDLARQLTSMRPLLSLAIAGDESALEEELEGEQKREREADRQYWKPLIAELETLRQTTLQSEEDV